jgi:hypothetical protein
VSVAADGVGVGEANHLSDAMRAAELVEGHHPTQSICPGQSPVRPAGMPQGRPILAACHKNFSVSSESGP